MVKIKVPGDNKRQSMHLSCALLPGSKVRMRVMFYGIILSWLGLRLGLLLILNERQKVRIEPSTFGFLAKNNRFVARIFGMNT